MDFYEDIVQRLSTGNTKINGTNFSDSLDFIEAIHTRAEFKGKVFYQNLLNAWSKRVRLPPTKNIESMIDCSMKSLRVDMHCKNKINEIEEQELAGDRNYVLYNYMNLMAIYSEVLSPSFTTKLIDGVNTNLFSFYLEVEYKGEDFTVEQSEFICKLLDKGALAESEIDNLIYANNNNTEFLVKRIIREYHSLIKDFENFDKKYESFAIENKPILHRYTDAKNNFYGFFHQYLDVFKKYDSHNLLGLNGESKTEKVEKIKWLGSPEQFGYIFGQLAKKGYIELPTSQGEGSLSKLADLCLLYFEILSTKGKNTGQQTTKENLERAINYETNQLGLKGKSSLEIPYLKDLK